MEFNKEIWDNIINLDDADEQTLKDYYWDDSDESLEDILFFSEVDKPISETGTGYPFDEGDIVMADLSSEGVSDPHRIYVIDSILDTAVGPIYTGYLMSSNISKANINNDKYPQNIFIDDYSSIIQTGIKSKKQAIIKLDKCFRTDNDNYDTTSGKGHVTEEFLQFIRDELSKIKNGEDTSKDFGDSEGE